MPVKKTSYSWKYWVFAGNFTVGRFDSPPVFQRFSASPRHSQYWELGKVLSFFILFVYNNILNYRAQTDIRWSWCMQLAWWQLSITRYNGDLVCHWHSAAHEPFTMSFRYSIKSHYAVCCSFLLPTSSSRFIWTSPTTLALQHIKDSKNGNQICRNIISIYHSQKDGRVDMYFKFSRTKLRGWGGITNWTKCNRIFSPAFCFFFLIHTRTG